VQRAFVRRPVVGLDREVPRGVLQRPAELGVLGDEVEDLPDRRAVATEQVLDPLDASAGTCPLTARSTASFAITR